MELSLTSRAEGPFEVLAVGGEIDVYTAPKLREAIVAAVDAGRTRLIIDVEQVDFLDSTGLGVLVGALKRVRGEGGSLDIVCTHERILKIFSITGLDKVFGLHDSVPAAVSSHDA
ncbi:MULTISPECIES: STAS domain-containing protein [Aeromicrobium]|jgi:anti-sigma B factor antagonist|uniref:STAS domain-containing protein n=1 Tax=Aeromicrobium TaxID=2040 RepID=UPI0002FA490B|nr:MULTISPECIES: STAS domain-containing protein [Aeromicrobium]TCI96871.1 anti-sigma factor antagonist [Aeromicrobium sp. IC_218]